MEGYNIKDGDISIELRGEVCIFTAKLNVSWVYEIPKWTRVYNLIVCEHLQRPVFLMIR